MPHFEDPRFFKEYLAENWGKHSPGICAYDIKQSQFEQLPVYTERTIPRQKRFCPIIPQQTNEIRPEVGQYYTNQSTLVKTHQFGRKFGSQVPRPESMSKCK